MSLSGIQSLLVRAPAAAARYAGEAADLVGIGQALDVDSVLVGTVLPVGDRCRVASQLVEVPSGRIVWSHTADVTGGDAFQLQDDLTRRIVDSLRVPLTAGERRALSQDVPASPDAYELFLRANRAALAPRSQIHIAVDLYRRCLEADPSFAPAWARIGRCHRVQAKFFAQDREQNLRAAEQALARALELHPDLPAAHHVHAYLELETNRVEAAIERLIGVVRRNPNDPEGYAGLVSALRYGGFLDASVTADARARALAPDMATSVAYSLMSLGRVEEALSRADPSNAVFQSWGLMLLGRRDEALSLAIQKADAATGFEEGWLRGMIAVLRRDRVEFERAYPRMTRLPDPEALIAPYMMHAETGLLDEASRLGAEALDGGYLSIGVFAQSPQFEDIRGREPMRSAWARAERRLAGLMARFSGPIDQALRA
jgi:tetratricopeptide (TPR) repeat protein